MDGLSVAIDTALDLVWSLAVKANTENAQFVAEWLFEEYNELEKMKATGVYEINPRWKSEDGD